MGLDVSLSTDEIQPKRWAILVREGGQTKEITQRQWDERCPGVEPVRVQVGGNTEVYSDNITHNLNVMAEAAELYIVLWHPEKVNISKASQLIEPLTNGLDKLRGDPVKYQAYNPLNNWGSYESLVRFVEGYLTACQMYPDASVQVSR